MHSILSWVEGLAGWQLWLLAAVKGTSTQYMNALPPWEGDRGCAEPRGVFDFKWECYQDFLFMHACMLIWISVLTITLCG